MDSKLTLKLDKDVIEKAKIYAEKNNMSLSKMVEKYFIAFINDEKSDSFKPTSLVNELSGIITLEDDYNHKDDYAKFISNKYK